MVALLVVASALFSAAGLLLAALGIGLLMRETSVDAGRGLRPPLLRRVPVRPRRLADPE
jgi:hypothetical protein